MPTVTDPSPARDDAAHPPSRRKTRRRSALTTVLVAVLLCCGLLLVLDRVGEHIAARQLAGRIQTSQHLSSRPDVSIGGFPFLTQVLQGRYHSVSITSTPPVTVNGVAVTDVRVHLQSVKVSTSDALHGTVRNVPVSSGTGTAVLGYAQVNTLIGRPAGSVGASGLG